MSSDSWSMVTVENSPPEMLPTMPPPTDMEMVEKMELETGQSSKEAIVNMLTAAYQNMWAGLKEATIKAMISQAEPAEVSMILRFAQVIPDTPAMAEQSSSSAGD
eukprot:9904216-Karenia_brevis.AAC.1